MAKVLPFSPKPPAKFGFEKARTRTKGGPVKPGQLNLFPPAVARVFRLKTELGPFEEALILDERNDERAEQVYRQAIEEGDAVADAYCNLGIIESKAGRVAKAFDCFTKSLEHNPRHFESHYNLGNLYLDEGNLRLAKLHYELALEVDPQFPNIHFNLGLANALNQEYTAAVASLKTYQELAGPEEGGKADELLQNLQRSLGDP